MKKYILAVDDELWNKIKELSKAKNMSINNLIIEILKNEVKEMCIEYANPNI